MGEVRKQAECEFVQRYVEVPTIPLMRMQILFLFLLDSGVTTKKIKSYLVPTILMQMGLDCHDEVTLVPQSSNRGIRTRQLSVLAGDFYSSKYYFLLAELEDVALIRHLSRAVCEINEMKTRLYTTKDMDIELSFSLQYKIDNSLYMSFVNQFGKDLSADWKGIIEKVIAVERLTGELEDCQLGQAQPRCLRNRTYVINMAKVSELLERKYEETFDQLLSLVKSVRLDHVREGILLLLEGCQKRLNNRIQV